MEPLVSRAVAVFLAVLHHGLGNMANRSIPAKAETVIATGDKFHDYMQTGEVPNNEQRPAST